MKINNIIKMKQLNPKRFSSLCLLLSCSAVSSFGQNGVIKANYTANSVQQVQTSNQKQSGVNSRAKQSVKGKVVDGKGEALIGVTVKIKGTKQATITNMDGEYMLDAHQGDVLEFSYVGFNTQEVKVNGAQINLTLVEDSHKLNEVVVTALGI